MQVCFASASTAPADTAQANPKNLYPPGTYVLRYTLNLNKTGSLGNPSTGPL